LCYKMGEPKEPEKAILFCGLLYHDENAFQKAIEKLEKLFGAFLFISMPISWSHTEYYREELGWPIYRRFILFDRIIDPSEIVDIKLATNNIEKVLSSNEKRTINIDPGYLTLSKLVLATTKNYTHRIYLGKGIYAEVTLYYIKGNFVEHRFTYRDYKSSQYKEIFTIMRDLLVCKINN